MGGDWAKSILRRGSILFKNNIMIWTYFSLFSLKNAVMGKKEINARSSSKS